MSSPRYALMLSCVLGSSLIACVEPPADAALAKHALTSGATCDPGNAAAVATRVERAFLDTIAFTEGTRGFGKDGYNVTFNYRYFDSCDEHPNLVICSGKLCSTAAGRYQFLNRTWVGLKMPSFWPEQQELGALELIVRRGVELPEAPMTATEFANALDRLSYEWSSLPPGRYGTPRRTAAEIREEYCRLAGCGATPSARRNFLAIQDDGLLYRYANDGDGNFTAAPVSAEWETARSMGAGADFDEDGYADFVSIDSIYGLELYSGDVAGEYWYMPIDLDGRTLRQVGAGGDYDRDGHADFIAVDETSDLILVRGDGSGLFAAGSLDTWAGDVLSLGGGSDFTSDGFDDFLQLRDDGSVWMYTGDGTGGFEARPVDLDDDLRLVSGAGDYSGDGYADVIAVAYDGEGYLFQGRGDGTFESIALGPGWQRVRFMN